MNSVTFTQGFKFMKIHRQNVRSFDCLECKWYFLAYMIQGHGKLCSGKTVVDVYPGDVFFIPKRLAYQSYWDADTIFHSYGFHFYPLPDRRTFPLQIIPLPPKLKNSVRDIPTVKPVDSRTVGAFYSTFADVLPYMKADYSGKTKLLCDDAIAYMTEHTESTVTDVARHCHVSESTLYSAFRNHLHTTPNTQRQIILCERAVDLLTTTDRPIEEIGSSLGFSSPSYFRKIICKHTGLSPRQIRKNDPL